MKRIIFLLILSCNLFAAEYFVSTSGDDDSTGTSIQTAWRNPSYALTKMSDGTVVPGDIIWILEGTYSDSMHFSFAFGGSQRTYVRARGNVVIAETTGGVSALKVNHASLQNVEVKGIKFTHTQGATSGSYAGEFRSAISFHVSDCVFSGNGSGRPRVGVYVTSNSVSTGVIYIRRNIIYGATVHGVHIQSKTTGTVYVENNTIVGANTGSGAMFENTVSNSYFRNNIVTNSATGIRYLTPTGTPTRDFNIVYNNSTQYTGTTQASNELTSDPLLVNIGNLQDYTTAFLYLKEDSPALNAANDGGTIGALPFASVVMRGY